MTKFAIYTYLFSPVNKDSRQGELFPDGSPASAEEAYERRHELLGSYFEDREEVFEIESDKGKCGVKLLMNRDGVIVLKLSNKKRSTREENFEVFHEPDEPSCFVIIDNRTEGIQSICIEPNRKAFTTTRQVARILEKTLNEHLKHEKIKVDINAKYSTSQFWQTVDKHPEGIKKVFFHFPYPNMPQISDRIRLFEDIARNTNSEPSLLLVGQGGEPAELSEEDTLLVGVVEACAASGKPIEVTPMGQNKRILIDSKQQVHEELSEKVLESLKEDGWDLFNWAYNLVMSFLKRIRLVYDA